jgi:hypothetical protein
MYGMRCDDWLQERAATRAWVRQHTAGMAMPVQYGSTYLMGFLAGYDFACPNKNSGTPLGAGLDAEAVFERAEVICKAEKGGTPLALAALKLIEELNPRYAMGVCQ